MILYQKYQVQDSSQSICLSLTWNILKISVSGEGEQCFKVWPERNFFSLSFISVNSQVQSMLVFSFQNYSDLIWEK